MNEPEDREPGWKTDPEDPAARRYWDGNQWSGDAVPQSSEGEPVQAAKAEVAAGWYPDPQGSGQQRYWNGSAWTEHLQASGAAAPVQVATTGQPGSVVAYREPKSIGLAIFLSIIFPGAGHLYAGVKTDFGVIFLVITVVNIILSLTIGVLTFGIGSCIGFFIWAGMAIWAAIDVNTTMKQQLGVVS